MSYRHRIQNPSVVKFNGTREAAIAFGNGLNLLVEAGILTDFTFDKATGRKDGEVDQIFRLQVVGAKHYETRPEKPFEDKSGDIYLMASLETVGKHKMGHSIHSRQRLGEVITNYGEPFRIVGIHYCSTDRYARETWLKKELVKWGAKHIERETYLLTDEQVERFIALGNE